MKNVIIFAVEGARLAIELRWVREVITMGHVTPVPGSPLHLVGAINVRGAITPVVDLTVLAWREGSGEERTGSRVGGFETNRGDGALLLDVDGTEMALRMVKVDAVITAELAAESPAATCAGVIGAEVLDGAGRGIGLVDPHALLRLTLAEAQSLAARHPAGGAAWVAREPGRNP